jgi:hypothetical protein
MFTNRFFTVFVVLVLVTLMAFAPQATAFAGQFVDPSTLNPPIPPEFNPECKAVGFGTLCTVNFVETHPPEATDLICGSGPNSFAVVSSDTRTVTGRRYYDENGNLTQRHFRQVLAGTFTNPLTGVSLDYAESTTIIHDLSVPGDLSTGTETFTGSVRLSEPQGGTVLIDAGRVVIDASDGSILFEAGPHPFNAYFAYGDTSALQPICDALS